MLTCSAIDLTTLRGAVASGEEHGGTPKFGRHAR
jgi:hypothetical protein